jgi:hypothetical protein
MKYGPHLVRLDVCCNDPDNGNFAARAAGIQLQDNLMELMAHDMRGPVFREHPEHIQISRRRFRCWRSKEWYGNWCWNAYWLDVDVAVELLAYAHSLGAFNCDQAEERLFKIWDDDRWSADDRDLLGRLLVKAHLAEPRERIG